MQIYCNTCGIQIPVDDVELDRMLAKCRRCNTVFDFSGQLQGPDSVDDLSLQRRRPKVPMPEGITLRRIPGESRGGLGQAPYRTSSGSIGETVEIERRWFSYMNIFMLCFCIVWDGFLVMWYGIAFKTANAVALLFPVLHVAVGVGLTYSTLAGLLNRSTIRAGNGVLSIRHGPIFWLGNRTIPAGELTQLYCVEKRGSKGAITYELHAITVGGNKLKLLSELPSPDQALFIEQEVEELLGIVDEPVGDEYRRRARDARGLS